ncbi:MAG: site-specific DNA-methyltransferase [candidate division Zixibacteria bacterium]|nr:site-specific DNA-methyltransferase [candidate division Zixibacteria bacterium]
MIIERKKKSPERIYRYPEDTVSRISSAPVLVETDGLIYCDDAINIMRDIPEGSVDLIMTDPPYGISYQSSARGFNSDAQQTCDNRLKTTTRIAGDTPLRASFLFDLMILEAERLLKPGGCICSFAAGGGPGILFTHWIQSLSRVLQFKQTLIWDRCRIGLGGHYRQCYEFILVAKKPGAACKWNGDHKTGNIFCYKRPVKMLELHPTPKPVELLRHLISLHTNPGDLVLDPFCGQGSTLIAARQLGRRFLGIDIVSQYCDTATFQIEMARTTLKKA